MGHTLENATAIFYKMRQKCQQNVSAFLLQNLTVLLQMWVITKGNNYYKMCWYTGEPHSLSSHYICAISNKILHLSR